MSKNWRSFKDAREFIRSLDLKSEKEWREYRKKYRPADIPSNPERSYSTEWKGIGDWLGTNRIATHKKKYRSYEEAKKWAQDSNINTLSEWRASAKQKRSQTIFPQTQIIPTANNGLIGGIFLALDLFTTSIESGYHIKGLSSGLKKIKYLLRMIGMLLLRKK